MSSRAAMVIKRCRVARAPGYVSVQAAFAAGLAFLPAQAQAGPVEVLADITVHPGDSRNIVLGYENGLAGLFVSGDGGHSFRLRPSQSVHTLMPDTFFPRNDFPILLTSDALLVGGTGGLLTGDAETCGLTQGSTLVDDPVLTLTPHPSNPDEAFLASFKTKAAHGGLFRRDKVGALTQLGPDDAERLMITGLKAVTREGSRERLRFFETGARIILDAPRAAPFVRYSDDLGATWIEHAVTLPGNGGIKLLAVDPIDPNRVLIMGRNDPVDVAGRVLPDPADDVLLSLDAGETFSPYSNSIITAHYATFASDGRFWLGDATGGLYFTNRLGDALSKVSDVPVHGLWFDESNDELLVAQSYELGRFKATDYSYCQMFRIYEALAYPACGDEDIATDPATKSQVCTSYCNATHYWYAPVCKNYSDAAGACGLGVLGTAFAVQLPNPMNDPKRCDGFALNYADPNSGASDAGTAAPDASTAQTSDAAAQPPSGDVTSSTEPGPHNGGCNVSATKAPGPRNSWASAAALAVLGLGFVRRKRRARRGARNDVRAALFAVTLLALHAGAGCGDKDADTRQEDGSAADPSSSMTMIPCPATIAHSPVDIDSAGVNGTLRAKVVYADHDPARKYTNTWAVELRDGMGKPVSDARFESQRTYMPVHGHDGTFAPTIIPEDAALGLYTFQDLNFTMTGPWQVQFDVDSESSGKDRFVLDVCIGG